MTKRADASGSTDAAAFRKGRDKGASWLLAHQQPSGAFRPEGNTVATYYKALWALGSSGNGSAGLRLAAWIRDNALAPDGDFAGPDGRGSQSANATYSNAWIILGAQRLGAFDVSYPAARKLLRLRTPHDGFYRVLPGAGPGAATPGSEVYASGAVPATTDLLSTSMSGLACLAVGYADAAREAGDHIVRMWQRQPDLPRRVYFQWHDEEELLTDVPGEAAASFCIDAGATQQRYFQVGIAAAFLAKLFEVTGEESYLRVAREAIDVTTSFAADRYATPQSGKVGWGASYVYRLTGEARYSEIACAVGHGLLALQGGTGCWGEEHGDLERQLEITAEFVALLNEIECAAG